MKNWYIVQSHSSFENKVAGLIKEEADKAKISEKFEEIVVPTHDVTEVKRGKRVQRKKKYFPGYVLIKIDLDKNAKLDGNELFKFFQGGKSRSGGGRPANVEVDLVISEPLSQTVPVLGRIIFDQYGPVSARIRGPVNKMLVDVGDRVDRAPAHVHRTLALTGEVVIADVDPERIPWDVVAVQLGESSFIVLEDIKDAAC